MNRSCIHNAGPVRLGEVALLLAFVLLAFTRGIWTLGEKSLWWDESLSLHRAEQQLGPVLAGTITLTDNTSSQITTDDHPPLYFLLLAASVRLLGKSEFSLRFLSLACVVLTVPLLYVTGRRLVDGPAGLAAAFLGAVSPMYLWYGQEARPYALVTFLALLSFYCFVRAFFGLEGQSLSRSHQPAWVAAYLLGSLGMVFTHYLSVLLILLEVVILLGLLIRRRRPRGLVLGLSLAVLLIALAPVGYAAYRLAGGFGTTVSRPGVEFVPIRMLTRDLLNSFSLGLSVDVADWYVWLLELLFLAFVLLGFLRLALKRAYRPGRASAWLLAGYLLVPIVLLYLFSYIQPAYMTSRHLMFVTPAFYLLMASGLTWLRGRMALVSAIGWVLLVGGVTYSTRNYFGPAYDKDRHREWGEYLREHVRQGDVVVVDPPQIAELYAYYAETGIPWVGLPLLAQPREQTEQRLAQLLERYDRVWLAYSQTPGWGDPTRLPETWLNSHAFRVDYRPFESRSSEVLIAAYLARPPLLWAVPGDAESFEVRYLPALRLVGYEPVSPARSGSSLHVQLFWAVDQPITREASVSLRLVDAAGHLWGQSDQCPFSGLFPMWQWTPGTIVRAEHEVLLAPGTPPGSYQLEMVLVDHPGEQACSGPPGQAIQPMTAPVQMSRGDRVLLGTVKAERATAPSSCDSREIEHPRRARYDGLGLIGFGAGGSEIEPGGRIAVRLYWRARQTPLPDEQFRLILAGAHGEVLGEQFIRPAGDAFPTSLWQAGDCYEGQFWVVVPDGTPAGDYRLELQPVAPAQRTGLLARLERRLRQGMSRMRLGSFRVVAKGTARVSTPSAPILAPQGLVVEHPMLATLGDQARFLGYDIDAESVQAGQPLTVTLYWQALAPMDTDYTVFTHLLGQDNQILGQKDSQPRLGSYPTSRWQPGEIITDSYSLVVAPDTAPGSYILEAGMYRLETLVRLPVTGPDGKLAPGERILLGEVSVSAVPTAKPTPRPVLPDLPFRIYFPLVGAER